METGQRIKNLRHEHHITQTDLAKSIYAISKRLGHSNITTTANTYAYLIDEYKDKTDKRIVKALSKL